jgi:hypothetical protein
MIGGDRRGRMRTPSAALAALLGLYAASCARPRTIPVAPPPALRPVTLDQVLAAYDGYCKGNETLSGSGELEVRDRRAGRARTLGVRVLASRSGRLYIKGTVAVVTGLEVVSDGERFWIQVPSRKTVWTGPADAEAKGAEADQAPYYALRPPDLTGALLCQPLAPAAGQTLLLEADVREVSLAETTTQEGRGVVRRRVWLDRQSLHPSRLRRYDASGELQSEATLLDWRDGLPHRVEVQRPREGYEAIFRFDQVQTNVPLPEKAFAPRTPAGYTVVEVAR